MNKNTYQIFDIKQLAELENFNKKKCRKALLKYKIWQANFNNQSDQMAIHYGDMEGHILRQHACQMISLYWTIRRDFRKAFDIYLKENCVVQSYNSKTSVAA